MPFVAPTLVLWVEIQSTLRNSPPKPVDDGDGWDADMLQLTCSVKLSIYTGAKPIVRIHLIFIRCGILRLW